ncbi:MAG: peptidoglycan DD-metalloendopeptidase family protein [Gammaproteobacteria bacterium]|nr:peptidoglycan DD-metalloendopeptidase family protein [Gammaproteobacteria bacterium]
MLAFVLLSSLLFACADARRVHVPVVSAGYEKIPRSGLHRVEKGDTIYSIAWRYGLDYRVLSKRNNINPPYKVKVGDLIYLHGPSRHDLLLHSIAQARSSSPVYKIVKPVEMAQMTDFEPYQAIHYWQWPARGTLIGYFSEANKGINIGGKMGDPIYSAAKGKIVYSGSGLRSYGNLIIIKHNSDYLTAYAHAGKVYVKEGDWVKMGQPIAEMGNSGARRVMLHFELRKEGQPVNPLVYLSKRRYN